VSSIAHNSMVIRTIESLSTDSDGVPAEIQQRLPSLAKLKPFLKLPFTGTNETEEQFVIRFVEMNISELQCRLAIAQILKDIDAAREPIPTYVTSAIAAVLRRLHYWKYENREDLSHLLQSLVVTE
jgi:hypothetical protein